MAGRSKARGAWKETGDETEPLKEKENASLAWYFRDMEPREPVFVDAVLTESVEKVLRDSQIVREVERVRFGRKVRTNHRHSAPNGVIRVVGDIPHRSEAQAADVPSATAPDSTAAIAPLENGTTSLATQHDELLRPEEYDATKHWDDDIAGLAEAGDEDEKYMSNAETAKHIEQYLTRAVPSLLTQAGLLALHRGTGTIAEYMADGMSMFETLERDDDANEKDDDKDDAGPRKAYRGVCCAVVPFLDRYDIPQHYTHGLLLKKPDETEDVNPLEVIKFIDRLVENLSEETGDMQGDSGGKGKASRARRPVACCSLLVGGTERELAAIELAQSVARRDPILMVEGSGGYADDLCSIIEAILKDNPHPTNEDFLRHIGTADPRTDKIISSYLTGKLQIVRKGSKVEDFQRQLYRCLHNDDTLVRAWGKYAQWRQNERQQARVYDLFNNAILFVSLSATFVSVLLTFILLMWERDDKTYVTDWNTRGPTRGELLAYIAYFSLTWAIMGFPIILALLQAINNKVNPAFKWVALRLASEDTLRQIYTYRTRTLDYSNEAIAAQKITRNKSGPSYATREELLAIRVNANSANLAASTVRDIALSQYTGSVPPDEIRRYDNGFSDLTPDEYLDIRVRKKRDELYKLSLSMERASWMVNALIHSFTALGTCLAGVAATGHSYLEAWIAFTTAVVSSCQRYSDLKNLTKLHEQYNRTDNHLSNVEMWFAKLGEHKDSSENQNQLVDKTEGIIDEEVQTWARLLRAVADKLREPEEKQAEESEKKKQKEHYDRTLKKEGLEGLSHENVKKALANPKSEEAAKFKRSMERLQDMGLRSEQIEIDFADSDDDIALDPDDDGDVQQAPTAHDGAQANIMYAEVQVMLGLLSDIPSSFADAMSAHDLTQLLDALKTKRRPLVQARRRSYLELRSDVCGVGEIGDVLSGLSVRDFYSSIKGCLLFKIQDILFKGVGLQAAQVVPEPKNMEDFIDEMYVILAEGQAQSRLSVIAQMREEYLRDALMKVPEDRVEGFLNALGGKLRGMADITRAMKLTDSALSELAVVYQYLQNCSDALADIDVRADMIRHATQLPEELAGMPDLTSLALEALNRQELLALVPGGGVLGRIKERMESQSLVQIGQGMKVLHAGTPCSRLKVALPRARWLHAEHRDAFILASLQMEQRTIYIKKKTQLVSSLRASKYVCADLGEQLNVCAGESGLKDALSRVKARHSKSHAATVLDRLDDLLTMFDLGSLLSLSEGEVLIHDLQGWRGIGLPMSKSDVQNVINSVSSTTVRHKLSSLKAGQQRELLTKLLWLIQPSMQVRERVWGRLVAWMYATGERVLCRSLPLDTSPEVIRCVFEYAQWLREGGDSERLDKYRNLSTSHGVLDFIGAPLIASAFKALPAKYIVEIFDRLQLTFEDPLISDVFELCGSIMLAGGKYDQYERYGALFLTGFDPHTSGDFHAAPAARRKLLWEAALGLVGTPMKELRALSPRDFIAKLPEGFAELASKSLSDLETQGVVLDVYAELVPSMPYRIFLHVCDSVQTFDLRDLARKVTARYLLPCALVLGEDLEEEFPEVALLEDVQRDELLACLRRTLSDTACGQFFTAYCEKVGKIGLKARMQYNLVLSLLRDRMRAPEPEGHDAVTALFCNFDADRFLEAVQTPDFHSRLLHMLEEERFVDLFRWMMTAADEEATSHAATPEGEGEGEQPSDQRIDMPPASASEAPAGAAPLKRANVEEFFARIANAAAVPPLKDDDSSSDNSSQQALYSDDSEEDDLYSSEGR